MFEFVTTSWNWVKTNVSQQLDRIKLENLQDLMRLTKSPLGLLPYTRLLLWQRFYRKTVDDEAWHRVCTTHFLHDTSSIDFIVDRMGGKIVVSDDIAQTSVTLYAVNGQIHALCKDSEHPSGITKSVNQLEWLDYFPAVCAESEITISESCDEIHIFNHKYGHNLSFELLWDSDLIYVFIDKSMVDTIHYDTDDDRYSSDSSDESDSSDSSDDDDGIVVMARDRS